MLYKIVGLVPFNAGERFERMVAAMDTPEIGYLRGMTARQVSAEILRTQDKVRLVSFEKKTLLPIKAGYGWKLVVCEDADAMRNLVGNPESFRFWKMESVEYLEEVLAELPDVDSTDFDFQAVSSPIFLCMWADARTFH